MIKVQAFKLSDDKKTNTKIKPRRHIGEGVKNDMSKEWFTTWKNNFIYFLKNGYIWPNNDGQSGKVVDDGHGSVVLDLNWEDRNSGFLFLFIFKKDLNY